MNKFFIKGIQDSNTTQKKEITASLEYLEEISLLAKNITNIIRSCRKYIKPKVVFTTSNRLRNAFRFKDQLERATQMYQFKSVI